jgi:hypothetical protein
MPVCTGKHTFDIKNHPHHWDVWEVFVDPKWILPNPEQAPDAILKSDQVDNEKLLACSGLISF